MPIRYPLRNDIVASKPKIRGRVLVAIATVLLIASVWEILGLRTHLGAWNHPFDSGYDWCALPIAKIKISDMQQGMLDTAKKDAEFNRIYHPGPHIRWPGFEYVQVYSEFRIPWRANISTFYTMVLPIVAISVLFGRRALRRCGTGSSG